MTDAAKPHKGTLTNWTKVELPLAKGLGYIVTGVFKDHPDFAGEYGRTSYLVKHDEATGEIETRNSRYTLAPQ